MHGECFGSFPAEVAARDFGAELEPLKDGTTDFRGNYFRFTFGATDTKAGSADAAMQFALVEPFAGALSIAFYDVDILTHQSPPWTSTPAVTTFST